MKIAVTLTVLALWGAWALPAGAQSFGFEGGIAPLGFETAAEPDWNAEGEPIGALKLADETTFYVSGGNDAADIAEERAGYDEDAPLVYLNLKMGF